MNTAPTTKKYLVDINLVTSVRIPSNIDPDTDAALPFIREALLKRFQSESAEDWMMENIGEIHPDEEVVSQQPQEEPTPTNNPEMVAYEEGRQAYIQFEANNGKRAKGNPYEFGTVENAAWNRGFNVG